MTRLRAILALLLLLAPASTFAANGTLAPLAYQTVLDLNGNPVSGAKICTYVAGTTTPALTWTEVTLTTANPNPILADSSGRFVAYLQTGASYKFVFQDASGTVGTCDGVTTKTVDNITAVPGASANLDIVGTAGQTLTAGQVVYLSDGSGARTAGQWFLADASATYSSTTPELGVVPTGIASGQAGTVRLSGSVTGLTSLLVGAEYFVGTAGAPVTPPPLNARHLGHADATTSLVFTPDPATPNGANATDDFRLTLTSGTPVTAADVTAATTLYASPIGGNRIALYSAAGVASVLTSAEFSIAVPATTSQLYDVFAWNNAGVATLELLAWTNDTTRATAIGLTTTGTYTKAGDLTRRYLGSVRTTTVSGQTEDSAAKRFLWNAYHRVRSVQKVTDATASWPYSTATLRQANGNTANQLAFIVGLAEDAYDCAVQGQAANSAGGVTVGNAIGDGSTTVASGVYGQTNNGTAGLLVLTAGHYATIPAVGFHFYVWLEISGAGGTTTWNGQQASGLFGTYTR